jgi:hypothetical protein
VGERGLAPPMRASPAPPVYGVRMVCHVKVNLLAQYRITTEAYSLALSAVERRMCASSKAGLSDLLKLTRDARRLSSDARDNFNKHVSKHGC